MKAVETLKALINEEIYEGSIHGAMVDLQSAIIYIQAVIDCTDPNQNKQFLKKALACLQDQNENIVKMAQPVSREEIIIDELTKFYTSNFVEDPVDGSSFDNEIFDALNGIRKVYERKRKNAAIGK